ncbi:MAG TPA: hypothetical protein VJ242_04135, partial [Patescibacteria group bacterium]|nr:hypothetical protein [Patescibacteria group bacterium]
GQETVVMFTGYRDINERSVETFEVYTAINKTKKPKQIGDSAVVWEREKRKPRAKKSWQEREIKRLRADRNKERQVKRKERDKNEKRRKKEEVQQRKERKRVKKKELAEKNRFRMLNQILQRQEKEKAKKARITADYRKARQRLNQPEKPDIKSDLKKKESKPGQQKKFAWPEGFSEDERLIISSRLQWIEQDLIEGWETSLIEESRVLSVPIFKIIAPHRFTRRWESKFGSIDLAQVIRKSTIASALNLGKKGLRLETQFSEGGLDEVKRYLANPQRITERTAGISTVVSISDLNSDGPEFEVYSVVPKKD